MSRAALMAISVLLPPGLVSGQVVDTVDVGGHRREAVVGGSGSPVGVFEAGMGDGFASWDPVFASVAEFMTAVAYSRAGYGGSEPGPEPRSLERINAELRALLQGLGLRGPYVLVGHSWGGLLARTYYYSYPMEVGALVLVDSSHERQFQAWQELDPSFDPFMRDEEANAVLAAADEGVRPEMVVVESIMTMGTLPNVRPRNT